MAEITSVSPISHTQTINASNRDLILSIPAKLLNLTKSQTISGIIINNKEQINSTKNNDNNQSTNLKESFLHQTTIQTKLGDIVIQGQIKLPTESKVEIIITKHNQESSKLTLINSDEKVIFTGFFLNQNPQQINSLQINNLQEILSIDTDIIRADANNRTNTANERSELQHDLITAIDNKTSNIILKTNANLGNIKPSTLLVQNGNIQEILPLLSSENLSSLNSNLLHGKEYGKQPGNTELSQIIHENSITSGINLTLKSGMNIDVLIKLPMQVKHNDQVIKGQLVHTELIENDLIRSIDHKNSSLRPVDIKTNVPLHNTSLIESSIIQKTVFINKNGTIDFPALVMQNKNQPYGLITLSTSIGNFYVTTNISLPEELLVQCNINDLIAKLETNKSISHSHVSEESEMKKILDQMDLWLKQSNVFEDTYKKALKAQNSDQMQKNSKVFSSIACVFDVNSANSDSLLFMLDPMLRAVKFQSFSDKPDIILNANNTKDNEHRSNIRTLENGLNHIYSQVEEVNSKNNKWSFFTLPTYNNEILQNLAVFIKNESNSSHQSIESESLSKRVILQISSINLGTIWIDTLFNKKNKRIDLIIRTEKQLEREIIVGLQNLFSSLKNVISLDGTIEVRNQDNFMDILENEWENGLDKANLNRYKTQNIVI